MLNRIKHLWQSARKKVQSAEATSFAQQWKPFATAATSYKLYPSCEKLPLDVFLDCLFDKDYQRLVIEGEATEQDLLQKWAELYAEYCQLTDAGNVNEHIELVNDCNRLLATISFIDAVIGLHLHAYDPILLQALEDSGIAHGILPTDSFDEMRIKLKAVASRSKRLVADYKTKQQQLQKIEESNQRNGPSRAAFETNLDAISRYMGFHVRPAEITVAAFVRKVDMIKKATLKENYKNR